ncbi:MAG: carboxymuconolactone decarboxylase family protein [Chloroflexota bacterium]
MPRLPEIFERDKLPEGKREVYDYLMKARGKISNGYATLLHSPEFVARVSHLGSYLRFESSLPAKTKELLAFATSVEMDNPYEEANHIRAAADLGVSQSTIDAVKNKSDLHGASDEEAIIILCVRELTRGHQLSDSTFKTAHTLLGNQAVIELVGTIGFYSMLACVHNAMQVRLNPP